MLLHTEECGIQESRIELKSTASMEACHCMKIKKKGVNMNMSL